MVDLHGISQEADDLIINEETGGQAYYNKTERHPDWPGGASGVTIGIGYDCGYSTHDQIALDWSSSLPAKAVAALQSIAGITGTPAHSHAQELHWIDVPWDAAMAVFHENDLPKWVDHCDRDLPNFDKLHPHCKGALVSLAFNRGESWNIPSSHDVHGRYREMRAIKADLISGDINDIPHQIRSMKRLWPVGGDLWRRREHEAMLFEKGLRE